jgi:hypothetical protein
MRFVAENMDEVPVRITADGIELVTADPTIVAMIDLSFPAQMFDPYTVEAGDDIEFMVNADDLKSVVSEARKADTVTFSVTQKNGTYTLHTAVERENKTLTDSVETLNYDPAERPSTTDLEYSGEATVAFAPLLDAIDGMQDSFCLGVDTDRLVLWSESDARGTVDEFRVGGEHVEEIAVEDRSVRSRYSREYLETLRKLQHSVETVAVKTGTDFPLRIKAVDVPYELSFIVAPRVDEDGTAPEKLQPMRTFTAGEQQAEPDAYAIVDESFENPVDAWLQNDDAEHRMDKQEARDRADELDREKVPVSLYALMARRVEGDT